MSENEHASVSLSLSALFLDIFRTNGSLVAAGDQLVAPLGLTSARWQVLGAVAMAPVPQPVAHIARDMGLARQGVQRLVNDLVDAGVLTLQDNPHHRRAKLVCLTPPGHKLFSSVHALQRPWVDGLAQDLDPAKLAVAAEVLQALRQRLEAGLEEDRD
ncbi:MarR family winged helix-turn-helix transcriptional regulator [Devosia sp.]|uniref:MarR family winged helix-turn-helix transcriptional regulator n=1 Tax=Devosia sp. TaxID=1871048 RepID=UPI0027373B65|nr:MarR family winged helix-turn-helix transcriptional regulator [Devosia sp.]MDP2781604.1 MarR family winged helix-turn-helix transcriptional regulator [Devosia sp.]